MNKAIIIGNLGKDPETHTTQGGVPVCSFNIATDESYTDSDGNRGSKVMWHTVKTFKKQAEICQKYLIKGSKVAVEGRLTLEEWQDRDGTNKSRTVIVASHVEFLTSKKDENGNGGAKQEERGEKPPTYDDIPF